jgi:hypothetical protein
MRTRDRAMVHLLCALVGVRCVKLRMFTCSTYAVQMETYVINMSAYALN